MTVKEKIKCQAIANNIRLGKYGEYTGENLQEILEIVSQEYNLTEAMSNYITELLNKNEKL